MLDVRRSPELQAAILGMRRLRSDLRPHLYREVRGEVGPAWLAALQQRAATRLEERVILPGARVRIGTDRFTLIAAGSTRAMRGGLVPAYDWPGAEFGARPKRKTYQRRSVRGRQHSVTRTLGTQWRSRSKEGRIAFDAASEVGTDLVARMVVVLVRFVAEQAQAEVVS